MSRCVAVITLLLIVMAVVISGQSIEDKYQVDYSIDGGKTWTQRGKIVFDSTSRNKIQFRPILTEDTKWPKDLLQIISDRVLKSSDHLIYQIRIVDISNTDSVVSSISMVCIIIDFGFRTCG